VEEKKEEEEEEEEEKMIKGLRKNTPPSTKSVLDFRALVTIRL